MPRPARGPEIALGFRVKSGWAAACLVSGPVDSPSVVDRRVVILSDPEVPHSKQPYHSATGEAETDPAKLASLVKTVERYAEHSLAALFAEYWAGGRAPAAVGIAVGTDGDPEKIGNQHIQAHGREGRLFRRVIEDAARAHRLPCSILVEREAYRVAAEALGAGEDALKRRVAELGRPLGGSWRAEDKLAALAAWCALA
jgi:hypothetical protein